VLLLGGCIVSLFYLRPEEGEPHFFPPDHNLSMMDKLDLDVFPIDNKLVEEVYVVWGVATIDRTHIDPYNPEDYGQVVWDSSFNISSPQMQQMILDTCERGSTETTPGGVKLTLDKDPVICFMREFRDWLVYKGQTFPVPQDEFYSSFKAFLRTPKDKQEPFSGQQYQEYIGWTKGQEQKVRYATIRFQSVVTMSMPLAEKWVHINAWQSFAQNQNIKFEINSHAYATAPVFPTIVLQTVLINTALYGAVMSIIVAFLALAISTMNIIVSLYAIFCIVFIVLSLLGFLVLVGWTIGIIESVALTVVVGLSVDYTVHLSISYMKQVRQLKGKSKLEVLQYTLAEIGISIVGGAATTASSVFPLFFTTIVFFTRFGEFVFVNILASLVVSLLLLVIILALIGPSENVGNLKYLFKCLLAKVRKKEQLTLN